MQKQERMDRHPAPGSGPMGSIDAHAKAPRHAASRRVSYASMPLAAAKVSTGPPSSSNQRTRPESQRRRTSLSSGEVCSVMPCVRHRSATFRPASPSRTIARLCSSLNSPLHRVSSDRSGGAPFSVSCSGATGAPAAFPLARTSARSRRPRWYLTTGETSRPCSPSQLMPTKRPRFRA